MAPVPSPLPVLLTDAKDTWDRVETILDWFSKIVTTAYAYSDMIINYRQDGADSKYKMKKAEGEAVRIMNEQTKKDKAADGKVLGKREWSAAVEEHYGWQSFR